MQVTLYESVTLTKRQKKHALIALGANLPFAGAEPQHTLHSAIDLFESKGLPVLLVSRFYETPCFPSGAGPNYVNAAAVVNPSAGMSASDVLAALHEIEAVFGRTRATRWGMRTLDLDLLAWGTLVLPDAAEQDRWRNLPHAQQANSAPDQLILPHPRLQDRAFVLVPLADVAPDWCHPVLGLTVAEMLAALPSADRDDVKLL
ncbi:MAG: 2-amino-4-hydroxy-6-hydroxymethyldihydropteridine diphosphokinase [Paracoccaceae bacterium]